MIHVKNIVAVTALCAFFLVACGGSGGGPVLSVTGDVKNELSLDRKTLESMDLTTVRDVPLVKERTGQKGPDEMVSVSTVRGVLLRDILYRAGMKHIRKWEPGVFIRVFGADGRQAVFSFGEIFYSSTGRSILIALEKDGDAVTCDKGIGDLIATTDLRYGREITCVTKVEVGRVDVELHAYRDQKKNVNRPAKTSFELIDKKSSERKTYTAGDLAKLPSLSFRSAVLVGDCVGFMGIHSFEGVSLRSLLESAGYVGMPVDYSRYVLVDSEDGFCTTFSFGEIFNSRLGDNIMIAVKKNGMSPGSEGFAMSVVREDSMGGRSVKRIHKIEVY